MPRISNPRHPHDVALGQRIKEVRNQQRPRVTLQWLARELGCTVQQVQKYESGENRIPWSRVVEIAQALDMPVIELIRPVVSARGAP